MTSKNKVNFLNKMTLKGGFVTYRDKHFSSRFQVAQYWCVH